MPKASRPLVSRAWMGANSMRIRPVGTFPLEAPWGAACREIHRKEIDFYEGFGY